ncbi:MAG TPA: hypothetical protein VMS00_13355 [Acidimicrobiales bacterium]|nr:hypothetical protein [Acidimicrobiales bacterium]
MSINSTAPVEAASPRSPLDRSAIELAGQVAFAGVRLEQGITARLRAFWVLATPEGSPSDR